MNNLHPMPDEIHVGVVAAYRGNRKFEHQQRRKPLKDQIPLQSRKCGLLDIMHLLGKGFCLMKLLMHNFSIYHG
jgi:hypothetical protein